MPLAYIPSPPINGIHIGPIELHFYGLLIACGVLAAVALAQHLWSRMGGAGGTVAAVAVWAVPFGLVGARLYSIATSWNVDTGGNPLVILEVWRGGLGIWGGVIGGIIGGLIKARRLGASWAGLFDCVAPALLVAQGIGRWGNYFNQELFGWPTHLPWAVHITDASQLAQLAPQYRADHFFQPTFLYESIWDIAMAGVLVYLFGRVRLRRGYLFAGYACLYTFGRFWTEYMRIDEAHHFFGLRLNDWSAIVVFVAAAVILVTVARPKAGDQLVGQTLPAGHTGLVRPDGDDGSRISVPPPALGDRDSTSAETQGSAQPQCEERPVVVATPSGEVQESS